MSRVMSQIAVSRDLFRRAVGHDARLPAAHWHTFSAPTIEISIHQIAIRAPSSAVVVAGRHAKPGDTISVVVGGNYRATFAETACGEFPVVVGGNYRATFAETACGEFPVWSRNRHI